MAVVLDNCEQEASVVRSPLSPRWRFERAAGFNPSQPDPTVDRWVIAQSAFAFYESRGAVPNIRIKGIPLRSVREANDIYTTKDAINTNYRIEALLLCPELTYEFIAKIMNIQEDTIKAYEKLFFAIRDEDGKVCVGPWVRDVFAHDGVQVSSQAPGSADDESLPLYWRVIAFQYGWKHLATVWRWPMHELGIELPVEEMAMALFREGYRALHSMLSRNANVSPNALMELTSRLIALVKQGQLRVSEFSGDSEAACAEIAASVLQSDPVRVILPVQEKADGIITGMMARFATNKD